MEALKKDHFRKLFQPTSIAIVGVSADTKKLGGGRCFEYLTRNYAGKLYPVNPKYQDLLGIKCFPSLSGIGEEVDLAVLSLPAKQIGSALLDCAAKGIRAICIFSSGFSEVGGTGVEMQKEINIIARENGLSVLGPNCEGYYNVNERIPVTFSTAADKEIPKGNVGLVTQSGAIGTYLLAEGRQKGMGFSFWISTGNEMDISTMECVEYLLDDALTDVIVCYSEGINSGEDLKRVGQKSLEYNKPIILCKAGRTARGQVAAASHTGALASNYRIYKSLLKAYGIVEARNFSEMIDFALFFSKRKFPVSRDIGIYTTSGAMAVLSADLCEDFKLNIPPMSQEGSEALLKITPFGAHSNPVDGAGTMNNPDLLRNCLGILAKEESISSLLVLTGSAEAFAEKLCASIINAAHLTEKPIVVSWVAMPEGVQQKLIKEGIPTYNDPLKALLSLSKAGDYAILRDNVSRGKTESIIRRNEKVIDLIKDGYEETMKDSSSLLPLDICASILSQAGIPIAQYGYARKNEGIMKIAGEIGYPVALKLDCSQLSHKTDLGGVILNINNEGELSRAVEKMGEVAKGKVGRMRGILIEEMVPYKGHEIMLGGGVDSKLGPYIMVGAGGLLAEFIDAPSISPVPIDKETARQMLEENKLLKLLKGYRGYRADVEALCDAMVKFSHLLFNLGSTQVKEIDLNPIFVFPEGQGIKAIDYRITLGKKPKE